MITITINYKAMPKWKSDIQEVGDARSSDETSVMEVERRGITSGNLSKELYLS